MTLEEYLAMERAKGERKRPAYIEDKLQIACKAWFDAQWPELSLLLHHSPNEGKLMQHDRDGAKRKAMGMRAGFPDFIFLHPNKFYSYMAIELKSAKGRQTERQKEYEQAVRSAGGKYVIVRSLDEFMRVVDGYIKDM